MKAAKADPPSVTVSGTPLKLKDPAVSALADGPRLETATDEHGGYVTRVSPPGTPVAGRTTEAATKRPGRVRANSFKARASLFDWETLEETKNPMRGFFTLFWMTMSAYLTAILYYNWKNSGVLIGGNLFVHLFTQGSELLYSEIVLILSLFAVVFIEKFFIAAETAFIKGWVPPRIVLLIQHIYQTSWFAVCIGWVYTRDGWSWTQSGAFTLHSIAMLMKQHSYMSYNNEMLFKHTRVQKYKARMDQLAGEMKKLSDDAPELTQYNAEWELCKDKAKHTQVELSKGSTTFPENVTFANFADYLLVPSLVYELEYPRTSSIRPWYLFEKTVGTIGIIMILYVTIEHFIYPVLENMQDLNFLEMLAHLLLPFMVMYVLLFHVIFECICNWFAEITRFADRQFYDDWWNSVTFDEYARKWNKPVHEFLLRHVYLESISQYKLSKHSATFLTFFLSSCLHELVMIVLAKKVRMYLFVLQMLQIPLILISRWSKLKRYPRFGNAFFWFSMYLGPPLLAVAYCREVYH
ncbi:MBOAT, membrane-bound O-acyltransferase family-domain-containing protein [Powellomyces hirtus]|nr:MBOAT, membrane-bound O-acyltransferase family-domain-containing protein [Powellomyces hirtus]